jgi:hypothetical protein
MVIVDITADFKSDLFKTVLFTFISDPFVSKILVFVLIITRLPRVRRKRL